MYRKINSENIREMKGKEFREYMGTISSTLKDAPPTTLELHLGFLQKKGSGFFKTWTRSYAILTKDK